MKKRLLAILLGVAMMLTLMPSLAFANDNHKAISTKYSTEELIGLFVYDIEPDNTACLYEWGPGADEISALVIPASVKFRDGVTRTVTRLDYGALYGLSKCKAVTVPASVRTIEDAALGYDFDESTYESIKISGFTIFGKTGSVAHKYAIANGFIFRDPEVEKEWNGTYSGAVPAAKGVKAKAAKKSVKVSWKKAKKKALKKFDKVEIQVCPDKGFQMANTKRVVVKKSKKSATVKGLVKGKTYYVRVRDVKGSGTGKLVSKWSKAKKVKIKK